MTSSGRSAGARRPAVAAARAEVDLAAPWGRPAPRATVPSLSTLPWCSTVTESANARMKSMSCSTTITVRLGADPLQQLAGLLALVGAHAGDRLVEQQHAGRSAPAACRSPATASGRARACRPACRAARSGRRSPAPRRPRPARRVRRRSRAAGRAPAPAAMSRFCSTVSSSNTLAVWNVRPTPEPGDLVRPSGRAARCRRSGPSRWPATSPVMASMMRGLAGAVRADQEPQVALEHGEVDAVDGDEAVEVDAQAADLEIVGLRSGRSPPAGGHQAWRQATSARAARGASGAPASVGGRRRRAVGCRRGRAAAPRPSRASEASPPGRNATTRMNSAPWK